MDEVCAFFLSLSSATSSKARDQGELGASGSQVAPLCCLEERGAAIVQISVLVSPNLNKQPRNLLFAILKSILQVN